MKKYCVPKMGFGGGLTGALSGASTGAAFGPMGAAIGGGIGLISGWMGEDKAEKARKEELALQEKIRLENERRMQQEYSRAVFATYPSHGVSSSSYYSAFGGKLSPNIKTGHAVVNKYPHGGKLVPLANDASLVKGDTHNQDTNHDGKTGVTLQDNSGQDMAEVENDEVIIGDKVFSHRLGFAPKALSLAARKGELEKGKRPSSIFAGGTREREIEKLDTQVNILYAQQGAMKTALGLDNPEGSEGIPTAGWGNNPDDESQEDRDRARKSANTARTFAKVNTLVGEGSRFIDNIYNQSAINSTPSIQAPVFNRAVPLPTNYNINPQLTDIKGTLAAQGRNIDNNTSNSTVARALKAGAYASSISDVNQLYGQKANIEGQLQRNDALNRQQVMNQNASLSNQYNEDVYSRNLGVQEQTSRNYANLSEDLTQSGLDRQAKAVDDETIDSILKTSSLDNDAAARALLESYIRTGKDVTRLKPLIKNSQAGRDLWNKYYPNDQLH